MISRKLHRIIGLALLLPFIAWILTGLVFLIKPGYKAAYEKLEPKQYSVQKIIDLSPQDDWLEIRILRTILGEHLLAKTAEGWQHLNVNTLEAIPLPSEQTQIKLLEDAIRFNQSRYGHITHYENGVFFSSTGVELTLDWPTLSIRQRGRDTRLISTLYKIHYLEWFGHKHANLILGISGLISLFILVYYGMVLYIKGRKFKD